MSLVSHDDLKQRDSGVLSGPPVPRSSRLVSRATARRVGTIPVVAISHAQRSALALFQCRSPRSVTVQNRRAALGRRSREHPEIFARARRSRGSFNFRKRSIGRAQRHLGSAQEKGGHLSTARARHGRARGPFPKTFHVATGSARLGQIRRAAQGPGFFRNISVCATRC